MNASLLIAFGVVIGIASGLVMSAAFHTLPIEVWAFSGALFGTALAVGGAVGVAAYRSHVRREEAAEGLKRQQLAARAILALDLSDIIDYAEQSASAAMEGKKQQDLDEEADIFCPGFYPDTTGRFQKLVELLDGDAANQIVDLLHCYQVQHARLAGALKALKGEGASFDGKPSLNEFEFTMKGTVELFLRAESLFPFARLQTDSLPSPPFTHHQVEGALRRLRILEWLPDTDREGIIEDMEKLPSTGRWRE